MTDLIQLKRAHPLERSAVVLSRGDVGLHIGIAFRASDEALRVLHLAWHYRMLSDRNVDEWTFVPPVIDPIDLNVVAGFCCLLERTQPRIPYGFRFAASRLDDEGRFIPGPTESGLTCTTFVMAVFEWARLPLLVRESWMPRDEDVIAQRALLEHLRQNKEVTDQHIAAIEAEVGCMRFRSEEAAAATSMTNRPASFTEAAVAGALARARFETLRLD